MMAVVPGVYGVGGGPAVAVGGGREGVNVRETRMQCDEPRCSKQPSLTMPNPIATPSATRRTPTSTSELFAAERIDNNRTRPHQPLMCLR